MAVTVTEKAYTARFSYQPAGGTITRNFFVDGLDPTQPDNVVRATAAQGIPVYQSAHPTVSGFYVMGYDSRPAGDEESPNRKACHVDVLYGTPQFMPNATLVEVRSLNGTRRVSRWPYGPLAGQPIVVGIHLQNNGDLFNTTFPSQISPDYVNSQKALNATDFTGSYFFQSAEVPALSSQVLLSFTRREVVPPNFASYLHKVNSTRWQGLNAGLWLLYQLSATQIPPSQVWPGGYQTTYGFLSAPDLDIGSPGGFSQVEVFKDRNTGKPVPGIDVLDGSNNGYVVVTPSGSVDFTSLGLPNVY